MPNRMLRESICTSESLAAVSAEAERLFIRLTTAADDFGRFDGRLAVIRSRCFPLQLERVSEDDVDAALEELEEQGSVARYAVGGKEFLWFPHWSDYQRTRATESKYPPPPDDDGGQVLASAVKRPQAPSGAAVVGVEDGDVTEDVEKLAQETPEFAEFWKAYPRRVGRRAARAAFKKALVRAPASQIITGAGSYAADPNRRAKFTAHPTTWLNQDRWEDDPLPAEDASAEMSQIADELRRQGL